MDIISLILAVFSGIGDWMVTAIQSVSALFYVPTVGDVAGHLTFLGTLAVCGLGISIIWMLIGFIQKFLHFRG